MQDRELYRQILGIEAPWFVERVELKLAEGEEHIHLDHHEVMNWPCPECGADCRLYDHQPERQWRYLDTSQYETILHAKPPRAECGQHGARVVKLAWAEPSSRFTALFERLANRLADGGEPQGRGRAAGPELGRDPRDHGSGGGARIETPTGRLGTRCGRGRESLPQRAEILHAGQ